jgi:hypothetical protein
MSELNELMWAEREDRELYTFYFQPKSIQPLLSRLSQPDLSQYIESTMVRPSGVIVHPKRGKDTAQAFLLAVLDTLEYEKSDVRLDTVPPFAQRLNWVAYYSNGDPDAKSAFRTLMREHDWPDEYFDEDYVGYYNHHLDVPRE